jgi:hypothetical protein
MTRAALAISRSTELLARSVFVHMANASRRRKIEEEVNRWLASANMKRGANPSALRAAPLAYPFWIALIFPQRRINLLRHVGKGSDRASTRDGSGTAK